MGYPRKYGNSLDMVSDSDKNDNSIDCRSINHIAIKVFKFGLLDPVDGWVDAAIDPDMEAEEVRTPLVVIDGREISWEEFGEMLMTFEGWQFKMQIADPSDDV